MDKLTKALLVQLGVATLPGGILKPGVLTESEVQRIYSKQFPKSDEPMVFALVVKTLFSETTTILVDDDLNQILKEGPPVSDIIMVHRIPLSVWKVLSVKIDLDLRQASAA